MSRSVAMFLSGDDEVQKRAVAGVGNGDVRDMGVSENSGTPKSSILIGFSIINHPFWGTPIFGNIHMLFFLLW